MNNKVSIIIPVYNTERYLERCVNSALHQSENNIEVVLVDDGSKDGSSAICDDLAKRDARIRVLHKENDGAAAARNAGLDVATGSFVSFIDSDDWISLDCVEYCLNLINQYGADAVEYEYVYVSSETEQVKARKEITKIFHDKEILQFYMQSSTKRGNYSVCICMFKREVLEGIHFREGTIAEDIEFKYRAYSQCKTLVYSNQPKYFYFQSGNSVSTGGVKQRDFQLFSVDEVLVDLTKDEVFGSIKYLGEVKKARTPMSLLCRIALYGISDTTINQKETIEKLICLNRKNLKMIVCSPIPINRKVLAILFSINYSFTESLIHFFVKK